MLAMRCSARRPDILRLSEVVLPSVVCRLWSDRFLGRRPVWLVLLLQPVPCSVTLPGGETMMETLREAVRSVPATLQLVYRLLRDERVDERKRVAVVAALAYAALPFDFIPDRFPIIGRVDDLVIGATTLQALIDDAGETIVREHWEASEKSLEALLGLVSTVSSFMPKPLRRLIGA